MSRSTADVNDHESGAPDKGALCPEVRNRSEVAVPAMGTGVVHATLSSKKEIFTDSNKIDIYIEK